MEQMKCIANRIRKITKPISLLGGHIRLMLPTANPIRKITKPISLWGKRRAKLLADLVR
ncbi:hypothetical protein [Paenibacillus sp. NPDC058174]|uniref:hypothetical protein n=1 Tax=Paenibacillus sp. NPDC058174 TaxID=3346366 RepID=UPI0036DC515E